MSDPGFKQRPRWRNKRGQVLVVDTAPGPPGTWWVWQEDGVHLQGYGLGSRYSFDDEQALLDAHAAKLGWERVAP